MEIKILPQIKSKRNIGTTRVRLASKRGLFLEKPAVKN